MASYNLNLQELCKICQSHSIHNPRLNHTELRSIQMLCLKYYAFPKVAFSAKHSPDSTYSHYILPDFSQDVLSEESPFFMMHT